MFANFSLASLLVPDVLVASGVIVASVLFLFTIGKYSVIPALSAIAFAAAFAALGVYVDVVPGVKTLLEYQERSIAFVLLAVMCFFIFRRHSYFEPSVSPTRTETIICAVVMAGFVLAVMGSFLPPDVVATLTPNIRLVFVSNIARTLWLLSPGVAFVVMRG